MSGLLSHELGLAAEEVAVRVCREKGQEIIARRWRSSSGEIDIIAREGQRHVFIEVKRGRDHLGAAARLGLRQMQRIAFAAIDYLVQNGLGMATPMRFDVALVDEDGSCRMIENAFGAEIFE